MIGAGQAGLCTGRFLKQRKANFIILDQGTRPGGSWRQRWDSLRLFTPAFQDSLPGLRFPGNPFGFPDCAEMADYLERYAQKFDLPIQFGTTVKRLGRTGNGFVVETSEGPYLAEQVVIASGAHMLPYTPPLSRQISPTITQLHSFDYRNSAQLQDGPVLIVGAANSGADIAMDLARERTVWLSGRHPGNLPFDIESPRGKVILPFYGWVAKHLMTSTFPWGRNAMTAGYDKGAGPLIRVKPADLDHAGVKRLPRVSGVVDGRPALDDGTVVDTPNVIWCTGFERRWGYVDIPGVAPNRPLDNRRGVVHDQPGLYVVGQPFQHSFPSHTVDGVGPDARYVVRQIQKRRR